MQAHSHARLVRGALGRVSLTEYDWVASRTMEDKQACAAEGRGITGKGGTAPASSQTAFVKSFSSATYYLAPLAEVFHLGERELFPRILSFPVPSTLPGNTAIVIKNIEWNLKSQSGLDFYCHY